MIEASDIARHFERHLSSPKQTWLLGAGVSCLSNIPLMLPLTKKVLKDAVDKSFANDNDAKRVISFIKKDIPDAANIEIFLTHLGDLTSMAERARNVSTEVEGAPVHKTKLTEVHNELLRLISETVRWGYCPERTNDAGEITEAEKIGKPGNSIVTVEAHQNFVRAVFGSSRAGLERLRGPVEFFTTNYDTLLEDALAIEGIAYADGFIGGGTGFWEGPGAGEYRSNVPAKVLKLHGSIDWYRPAVAPSPLLRVRHGDAYPPRNGGSVMIYPQATKYMTTQRDPFAGIFQCLRRRLQDGPDRAACLRLLIFRRSHRR